MQKYNISSASQRQRLLAWLREHGRIDTITARCELDIMSPAARVLELRRRGFDIITNWLIVDTGSAKHRMGEYVLMQKVATDV